MGSGFVGGAVRIDAPNRRGLRHGQVVVGQIHYLFVRIHAPNRRGLRLNLAMPYRLGGLGVDIGYSQVAHNFRCLHGRSPHPAPRPGGMHCGGIGLLWAKTGPPGGGQAAGLDLGWRFAMLLRVRA